MGAIRNFLKHFNKGDPVAKVCDTVNLNRIANILEDIEGMGCRIHKPTDAEGKGWMIIVDGSTDMAPGDGLPPGGYQYQVLQLQQHRTEDNLDAVLEPVWDWVRYVVPS